MKVTRADGFYWVKFRGDQSEEVTVGRWDSSEWSVVASDESFHDDEIVCLEGIADRRR